MNPTTKPRIGRKGGFSGSGGIGRLEQSLAFQDLREGDPPARLQAVALGIHEKFGPILGKRLTGLFVLFTDHLEDLLQLQ